MRASQARLDQILQSHVIEPSALRRDDFDAFFAARYNALLSRIEQVMEKPIAREALLLTPQALASALADLPDLELEETA